MSREGKARVLSDKELKCLLNRVEHQRHGKRNVALIRVSHGIGLRAKEMAALSIKDVMGADGNLLEEINLHRSMTKGGKSRRVYLTEPFVVRAVNQYLQERLQEEGILFNRAAPLFKSQKGSWFTPNTLQQLFHRLYAETGYSGASSHSGRRFFATTLINSGKDIKSVSLLMGHSTIGMTAQYVEETARVKIVVASVMQPTAEYRYRPNASL